MAAPELVVRVAANLNELRQNLKEGAAQIETTKTHLQQMANGYDGSRIISQAGATTAAITGMGGAAKLTVAEQARVNAVLTEAIEKYRALGQQAPPNMLRLADETKNASNTMGEFKNGLSQVDRVLASTGISIGPQVAAINELSAAWGKSAAQMGLVATAGLALATGMAGWQIGSVIAEYTSLDEKLGDGVATLMGWSASAESAAARQDTLRRATAEAKREITDYREAILIMTEATRKKQAAMMDFESILAKAKDRIAQLTDTELRQFEAAKAVGASQEQLRVKFNLTAAEMAVLNQRMQEQKAAQAEVEAASKKLIDAQAELKSAGNGWRGTIEGINTAVAEQVKKYLEAGVSQSALATVYNLTTTQVKALATAIQEEKKAIEEAERAEEKKAKTAERALLETTRLWNEYNELVISRSGTTTDIQIAQIARWAADVKAKAIEAGTDTEAFYAALEAVSKEKMASVMVDWDALRENSRLTLEETAAKAWATYEAMLARSHEFSDGTIAQFRKTAEEAQKAADSWSTSFGSAMKRVDDDVATTTANITRSAQTAALTWSQAMSLVAQGQGTMTMTVVGRPMDTTPWGRLPNIPKRADGGPAAAGMPHWVGERGPELFVPERSGYVVPHQASVAAMTGGGVSIVNHITVDGNILGSQRELARVVSEAMMSDLRARGFRNPSGA